MSIKASWRFKRNNEFKTDIWDIFNDKVDYSVKTFDALVALHGTLHSICSKFELLDKSNQKAAKELEKYLANFGLLQVAFGEVDELTTDDVSKLADLNLEVKHINLHLEKALGLVASSNKAMLYGSSLERSTLLNEIQVKLLTGWFGEKVKSWIKAYDSDEHGLTAEAFHEK